MFEGAPLQLAPVRYADSVVTSRWDEVAKRCVRGRRLGRMGDREYN